MKWRAEVKRYDDHYIIIRNRAGEIGNALMERYRNERKIELAYEQHRYFDIRRWMIAPDVIEDVQGIDIRYPVGSETPTYSVFTVDAGVGGRTWDNKSYFLPIHFDEMNKNDLLIQNPEY